MRPIFSKNVSTGFVKKLLPQRKRLSIIDNLYARAGRKPILSEAQREQMQQHVQAHPGATLDEIRRACCLRCCLATVDNTLRRMGLTNKKQTLRAAEARISSALHGPSARRSASSPHRTPPPGSPRVATLFT